MLVLSRYPFFRILPAFIAGIIINESDGIFSNQVGWILLFFLVIFTILYKQSGHKPFYLHRDIQGLFIFTAFLIAGYATPIIRYPSPSIECSSDSTAFYLATAISCESKIDKKEQCIFNITEVHYKNNWISTNQKVLAFIPDDDTSKQLPLNCVVLIKGHPSQVRPTMYQESFDYKKYLARRNIQYVHFLKPSGILVVQEPQKHSFSAIIASLRRRLKQNLRFIIPDQREYSVALAMLLGDKSKLEKDVRNAYSAAGVAHILAVSGLHTGIVFWIVSWLFMPLKRNPSFRWIYYAIVTASIWFYALLTGLSPSVTRAALMLTFVLLGTLFNGKYQIFNSIAASAFFILLIQPWLIYSVSFQLSYLAVFGIVLLYPKMSSLFKSNARLPEYLWKIICVSIAAQMATFPLVIYYFHQFSPFFIISNLLVLPAATLIITTGTILLIIESIGLSIPLLNKLLETVLHITNQTVYKIESLPGSTLNQLHLEPQAVWLIYILVALVISGIYFRSKWMLVVTAAFSILLSADLSLQIIHNHRQKAVIVYKQSHWLKADYIEGNILWKFALRTNTPEASHNVSMPDSINKYIIYKSMSILKSGRIHTTPAYDLIVFKGRSFLFLRQFPPVVQRQMRIDYLFVFNPDFIRFKNNLKNLQYDHLIYAGQAIANFHKIYTEKDYTDLNQKKILRISL